MEMKVRKFVRGWVLLCSVIACFICAPKEYARAEITADSFIALGNDRVVQDGKVQTSGNGWAYDEKKNILTLKNYNGGWMRVDDMGEGFTICVEGDNILHNHFVNSNGRVQNGLNAMIINDGSLTITGEGTLSNVGMLDCEETGYPKELGQLFLRMTGSSKEGIPTTFTVNGSVTINAYGTKYSAISIYQNEAPAVMSIGKNCKINATVELHTCDSYMNPAIRVDEINIEGTLSAIRNSVNDIIPAIQGNYDYENVGYANTKLKATKGLEMGYGQSDKSLTLAKAVKTAPAANCVIIDEKNNIKENTGLGNKYKIIYKLNGGTNNGDNPATYSSRTKIALADPYKEGYSFVGWYQDKKCKKQIKEISASTKKNITVYAKWKKIESLAEVTVISAKIEEQYGVVSWKPVKNAEVYMVSFASDKDMKNILTSVYVPSDVTEAKSNCDIDEGYVTITACVRDSGELLVVGKESAVEELQTE